MKVLSTCTFALSFIMYESMHISLINAVDYIEYLTFIVFVLTSYIYPDKNSNNVPNHEF